MMVLHRDRSTDTRICLVANELEVLDLVAGDSLRLAQDAHRRQRLRGARQLQLGLLEVVEVQVNVATGPDELTRPQVRVLSNYHRQQCVAGDVEGHAQEDVGRPLVQLAVQERLPTVTRWSYIELEQQVARWQRHLVDIGWVPGSDDVSTAVWVSPDGLHDLANLVDPLILITIPVERVVATKVTPLMTVHWPKVTVLVGPLVPDTDTTLLEPADVRIAAQEPDQLADDAAQVELLGCEDREALLQIEPHLVAKHAARAGTSAVVLVDAVVQYVLEQIEVLTHLAHLFLFLADEL